MGLAAINSAAAQVYRIKGSGESVSADKKDSKSPEIMPDPGIMISPQNSAPDLSALGITNVSPGAAVLTPQLRPFLSPEQAEAIAAKADKTGVNHEVFAKILQKYVTKGGWVDYRGLKRDKEAMENLQGYIDDLSGMVSDLQDPEDKLASWLNLYNATILNFILKNYPADNLMKIRDFFGTKIFKIGDKELTINDVDEEIFRGELKEPRTVFGRINGSSSGPRFTKEPFTAAKVDAQLEERTAKFVRDPFNVSFEPHRKLLTLNSVFMWYEKDFLNLQGFLMAYLNLPAQVQWVYGGSDFKLNDEKLH